MKTAIYLRKSRQDEELEKKGENETLSRHRSTLLKIAKEQDLNIVEIKEEVVSGESVSYRPKMLELLEEIKNNMYDAVLVMDIDRLGRGNMSDQGLILETFKQSKTKIITPRKTYDLSNEWDEEYSEFEAFMARKELKLITRRMQRGRIKSVEEGKFISSSAPLGYKFEYVNNGKDRILVIDDENAEIIRYIFRLYLNGKGAYRISAILNELGYTTSTGRTFYEKGVREIIKNKTYAGYIVWNKVERKRNSSHINDPKLQVIAKGMHEAIISEDDWEKAQIIRLNRFTPAVANNKKIRNPLAGLVKCERCGATMQRRKSTYQSGTNVDFLVCVNCKDNGSAKLILVENAILTFLEEWINCYKDEKISRLDIKEESEIDSLVKVLSLLQKESTTLVNQKNKLHDLLEKGVYDIDTYLDRSKAISQKIEDNKKNIIKLENDISNEKKTNGVFNDLIPEVRNVLDLYKEEEDSYKKNRLLKTIIQEVIYSKEPNKRNSRFELDILPVIRL